MFVRNYRLLDYLVEIVECGSLQGAADHLHVSAPVVSKALSDLEEVMGSTLLVRSRGHVRLTETGETIYQYGRGMRSAAEAAMNVSRELRRNVHGNLRLTLPSELAIHWLPPILRAFQELYPDVAVEILASDDKEDLVKQSCDLAIRAYYRLTVAELPQGTFQRLPVSLLAGKPFAPLASMPPRRRLASIPFIDFGLDRRRTTLAAISRKNGHRFQFAVEGSTKINSAYLARDMVVAGLGMALLVESAAKPLLQRGRLIAIAPELDFGWLGLKTIQRDNYPAEPALAFQRYLASMR